MYKFSAAGILRLPDITKGALFMIAATFFFSAMNSMVRIMSSELPPLEIAFFRNFFALAAMLPLLFSGRIPRLSVNHFKLHVWRSLSGAISMALWFTSLAIVPLADAVALNFTLPLFTVAGAALFLGEPVGPRRWAATAIGFCGVLIIIRPGFADVSWIMTLPIAAAVFMAIGLLVLKHLSGVESAATNVLYMNLLMAPMSLVPALFVWRWPDLAGLGFLAVLGVLATLAHLCLTRGLQYADASALMPFDFARLLFISLFAFMLFGEVPPVWTWLGGAVIAGSAIYINHREAAAARARGDKETIVRPVRDE